MVFMQYFASQSTAHTSIAWSVFFEDVLDVDRRWFREMVIFTDSFCPAFVMIFKALNCHYGCHQCNCSTYSCSVYQRLCKLPMLPAKITTSKDTLDNVCFRLPHPWSPKCKWGLGLLGNYRNVSRDFVRRMGNTSRLVYYPRNSPGYQASAVTRFKMESCPRLLLGWQRPWLNYQCIIKAICSSPPDAVK